MLKLFFHEPVFSTKACDKLDSLEKEVINRVYLEEQQLMDIAHTLGYSRCHISRVKKKALETLFSELTKTVHLGDEEALKAQPNFDLAELDDSYATERRKIHRRRPRARKVHDALEAHTGTY